MLQRVLGVTFAQALRSAAIVILPLAFITLIAWATAGSARITGIAKEILRSAINELPKAIRKAKIAAIHH